MIYTGIPAWFILICVLLASGYAFGLYFRERSSEMAPGLRTALGAVRFLSVFTIAFLLLSPFIKTITQIREKPIIVIAHDNSGSLTMNADSSFYISPYPVQLDELAKSLADACDVRLYSFGESLHSIKPGQSFGETVNYGDKLTDISNLFASLSSLYSNRNLGALILSTDGIYNSGYNPVYQARRTGFPVYAIALGDSAQKKDIILSHVAYNRLVYLDNKFPLQVTVLAHDCEGNTTTLRVSENGQTLFTREINIDQTEFTATIDLLLEAREIGLKKYRLSLSPVAGELSTDNNSKDIFVEVLDAHSKILILYHSPHPDIAALRNSLESSLNFEVEDFPASDFTGPLEAYNLVVLHQLPALSNPASRLLLEIADKELPALYIMGTQSDIARLNQVETGLRIITGRNLFEEALPSFNPAFGLFSLSEETRTLVNSWPPLMAPSGDYQAGNMIHALAYQSIGSVQTSRPMILLGQNLQYRSGMITGEGLWRWRMMNYASSGNQDAFNELVSKIFQYLSLKEQKRNLRIYHKGNFAEYERILLEAEVYNRNYELVNEPELEIIITDEEGKQYPFTFSKSLNSYRLDAGRLLPGNYSYRASVSVGEEVFTANGQFSVSRIDLESMNLVADHELLRSLASQSAGQVYLPEQMDELRADILNNSDIKPVVYSRKNIKELINFPLLLAAIIGLLSIEWFVRKRSGSY